MKRVLQISFKIVTVLVILLFITRCSKDEDASCKEVVQGDFVLVE